MRNPCVTPRCVKRGTGKTWPMPSDSAERRQGRVVGPQRGTNRGADVDALPSSVVGNGLVCCRLPHPPETSPVVVSSCGGGGGGRHNDPRQTDQREYGERESDSLSNNYQTRNVSVRDDRTSDFYSEETDAYRCCRQPTSFSLTRPPTLWPADSPSSYHSLDCHTNTCSKVRRR